MAHWDEERDRRWVEMMRQCNVPNSEWIIEKFATTGDNMYLAIFVEQMRMPGRRTEHGCSATL